MTAAIVSLKDRCHSGTLLRFCQTVGVGQFHTGSNLRLFPSLGKAHTQKKEPSVMAHTSNPSTGEAEAGGP